MNYVIQEEYDESGSCCHQKCIQRKIKQNQSECGYKENNKVIDMINEGP